MSIPSVSLAFNKESPTKFYNICPREGAVCKIIVHSDCDVDDLKITFPVGEEFEFYIGEVDSAVEHAIECALVKLRAGESALVDTTVVNGDKDISNETGACNDKHVNVKLVSFVNGLSAHQLTPEQKFSLALKHKARGVELFKAGNYKYAFDRFRRALRYLILMLPSSSIPLLLIADFNKLRVQCYANLALCQMHAGSYEYVVENCTKALCIETDNVKCIFRRASAYFMLQNFDSCKSDVQNGLKLEPNSKSFNELNKKLMTG